MTVSAQLDPEIRDRVKALLRRDLKLGEQAEIPDDMALIGGAYELDSLDVVMMITSVEKEFGVSLADEVNARDAFASVATLVRFISDRRGGQQPGAGREAGDASAAGAVASSASSAAANGDVVAGETDAIADPDALAARLAALPHAEPFRFITRLTTLEPGHRGEGVWELTGAESFFAGHFPGRPIVPGVLISESLAQLSGLVGVDDTAAPGVAADLVHTDVRFKQPLAPPAALSLESRLTRRREGVEQYEVRADLHGQTVAEGRLALKRRSPDVY